MLVEVGSVAKSKKRFSIEIEATLEVVAFDEATARRKIERLLGQRCASLTIAHRIEQVPPDRRLSGRGG